MALRSQSQCAWVPKSPIPNTGYTRACYEMNVSLSGLARSVLNMYSVQDELCVCTILLILPSGMGYYRLVCSLAIDKTKGDEAIIGMAHAHACVIEVGIIVGVEP